MGHIGHKLLALILTLLQAGGHIVEGQGQILHFVGAFGVHLDTGVQIAVAKVVGSLCHIPQRLALTAGYDGHDHHSQQNRQNGDKQIGVRDLLKDPVDLLHGSGDDNNAHPVAVTVHNGNGGHEARILIESLDDTGGGDAAGGEYLRQKIPAYHHALVATAEGGTGAEYQTAGTVADHRIRLGHLGHKA